MHKLKRLILALALIFSLSVPALAQTNTSFITDKSVLQEEYRSLLRQLIDLLLQQVAILQAQLAELQLQQFTSIPAQDDKQTKYSGLQARFLEVTPYQVEWCRNDWLQVKKARLNIDVFTPEGMETASSTGRFDNQYEDNTYADCLTPSSPQRKTPDQLKAYNELKSLEGTF